MTENSFSRRLRNLSAVPECDEKWKQYVDDMFKTTNVLRQTPHVIKKHFETMLNTMKGNCTYWPGDKFCMSSIEGKAG